MGAQMPFREKVAWVSLVSTVIIWSWYFCRVWQAIQVGKVADAGFVTLFFTALGVIVVVQVGILMLTSRGNLSDFDTKPDERESLIDGRANGAAYLMLMNFLVVLLASTSRIGDFSDAGFASDPAGSAVVLMANGVVLCIVLAAVVHDAALVFFFRRYG